MSSKKPPPLKEDISPNLVPMIDIMFLLLLFFMLGADMSQRESVTLMLPKADQIKEEKENTDPTTTVNIHHMTDPCAIHDNKGVCRESGHWLWSIQGQDYTLETIKGQLQIEADEFKEDFVDQDAGKVLSAKKLLIRADSNAPYGDIQRVIEMAGLAGMYKVEVAGAKPGA